MTSKIVKQNNHVYIAKGILNKFATKDARLFYIENDYNKIRKGFCRTFNIEINHYTDQIEKILNQESEDKFIKLINNIEKFNKLEKEFLLKEKDNQVLKKYLSFQILRNEYIYYKFEQKRNLQIMHKETKNIMLNYESESNFLFDLIKDCDVDLIYNKSNTPFLLPITSTITLNSLSKEDYVLLLFCSPNFLFAIYPKTTGYKSKFLLSSELFVKDINLKLLYSLKNEEVNQIIGEKAELIRVTNLYKKGIKPTI